MAGKLDVPSPEYLSPGNLACAGCPEMLGFRHVLKVLGPDGLRKDGFSALDIANSASDVFFPDDQAFDMRG